MRYKDKNVAVMHALGKAMGFTNADLVMEDYLNGLSVLERVGRHGIYHFNLMMLLLSEQPPLRSLKDERGEK